MFAARRGDPRRYESPTGKWDYPAVLAPDFPVESTAMNGRPHAPRYEAYTENDDVETLPVGSALNETSGETAGSVQQQQAPKQQKELPWESKAGYVMGQGELGLLNELQLPRRGAMVQLPADFLILPRPFRPFEAVGAKPSRGLVPTISPIAKKRTAAQTPVENTHDTVPPDIEGKRLSADKHTVDDGDGRSPGRAGDIGGNDRDPADPAKFTRIDPSLSPLPLPTVDGVPVPQYSDPPLEEEVASIDEVRRKPQLETQQGEQAEANRTRAEERGRRKLLLDESGDSSSLYENFGNVPSGFLAGRRKVETASSAERVAAFPPGTRFRVAVDKGATGLGITVKEIQGRFFVYRLQALPDGSPGAAEVELTPCFLPAEPLCLSIFSSSGWSARS